MSNENIVSEGHGDVEFPFNHPIMMAIQLLAQSQQSKPHETNQYLATGFSLINKYVVIILGLDVILAKEPCSMCKFVLVINIGFKFNGNFIFNCNKTKRCASLE